jgi:hypothetical protein
MSLVYFDAYALCDFESVRIARRALAIFIMMISLEHGLGPTSIEQQDITGLGRL